MTPLEIVLEQAEDEGLWFAAGTAAEGYLQQELRRLHEAVDQGEGWVKYTPGTTVVDPDGVYAFAREGSSRCNGYSAGWWLGEAEAAYIYLLPPPPGAAR